MTLVCSLKGSLGTFGGRDNLYNQHFPPTTCFPPEGGGWGGEEGETEEAKQLNTWNY